MNEHRESIGLDPLIWDSEVYAVAQAHTEDMNIRDFFSHTNPDGDDPFDRLRAAGINYSTAGENIASGYTSAADVLNGWLNSPGHKANIENGSYTHHGVGYDPEENLWTHVFIGY